MDHWFHICLSPVSEVLENRLGTSAVVTRTSNVYQIRVHIKSCIERLTHPIRVIGVEGRKHFVRCHRKVKTTSKPGRGAGQTVNGGH